MSYRSRPHSPVRQVVWNHQQADLSKVLQELRNDDPYFGGKICIHHLEKGEVLADATKLGRQMYVLMQGQIHLVRDNEGRRLVVTTLEPGAIFGEGALASSSEVNVIAEAAMDATVWSIPASEARTMTIQYPVLCWGLLQTHGRRLRQIENSLEDMAYKRLPARLAMLLVNLCHGNNGSIEGISHQKLAERLGAFRETISAILRDFKKQGLVDTGYRRIDIVDVEALTELAGVWEY